MGLTFGVGSGSTKLSLSNASTWQDYWGTLIECSEHMHVQCNSKWNKTDTDDPMW